MPSGQSSLTATVRPNLVLYCGVVLISGILVDGDAQRGLAAVSVVASTDPIGYCQLSVAGGQPRAVASPFESTQDCLSNRPTGFEPADSDSHSPSPSVSQRVSAIWERQELPVHKINTRFMSFVLLRLSLFHFQLIR